MSKLIRHAQKRGTALFLATGLIGLILLSLFSFIGGPQQSRARRDSGRDTGERAGPAARRPTATDAQQPPSATARLTAAEKGALRKSAVPCEEAVRTARLAGI